MHLCLEGHLEFNFTSYLFFKKIILHFLHDIKFLLSNLFFLRYLLLVVAAAAAAAVVVVVVVVVLIFHFGLLLLTAQLSTLTFQALH